MILVSSCLIGKKCRYDGESCLVPSLAALAEKGKAIDVCPEVLGGLSTPRMPAEITENQVIDGNGKNVTKAYLRGAEEAFDIYRKYDCRCAVLKEKSPSCGCHWIYDGTFTGRIISGEGMTVRLFRKNGIVVMNEKEWEEKNK